MPIQPLHLWAIVPPPDLAARIDGVRKEFSANFDSVKALKPPVHITLYKPFKVPPVDLDYHLGKFRRWVGTQPCFTLELKNFGFFEDGKSPVVFIDVVPDPHLKKLNTGISSDTKKFFVPDDLSKDRFHPHFTIGYRDISPAIFPEIKQAYKNRRFSSTFEVRHVSLFRHSGAKWLLLHELPLETAKASQGSLW